MQTLFMAYANNSDNPLLALRDEDDKVNAALSERAARQDFIIVREQYTTRETITRQINTHQQNICLFLYSGHAGSNRLLLEDGAARADGIAALLAQCPNLKIVVLNGCSTGSQVKALMAAGVPVVIATSAPIGDETAKTFAVHFFTELSKNRQSIRVAFQSALRAAQVFGDIKAEIVARGALSIPNEAAPLWILSYDETKADVLDNWRLPSKPLENNANEFISRVIGLIFNDHLQNDHEDSKGQDIVLKRLPYTISEPLRNLLAPRDGSGQLFFDQPSPERFKMLLYAYRSILNFVTFALLSQLWDEKIRAKLAQKEPQNPVYTEGVADALKNWLLTDLRDDERRSLLPLFTALVTLFKEQNKPFFFSELTDALQEWDTDETQKAVAYLEQQIAENPRNDLEYRCAKAEESLAWVLYCFGFLVNYTLTSVKDIGVLFYMHNSEAQFDHKIVRLQQQMTALEDRSEKATQYFKTASVLLRDSNDKSRNLYLSPFLIDQNAYIKTTKANLHYFVAFDLKQKQFHFKHVSRMDSVWKVEKKRVTLSERIRGETNEEDDYFSLINGQFSAFCEAMLGKTLDKL